MRLTRKFLQSVSVISTDSSMSYELYDLDDNAKTLNPQVVRGIRFALLSFLAIVMIGAIAILGIGIWTLEAEYGNKQVSELISAQLYKVDSYLLIIGGSAIIMITIVGILGVMKEYRCLLGLHLGLLAFMSVMLFVAGVLGYVLVSELEDKVRDKMEQVIVNNYGVDLDKSGSNRVITNAWDEVQQAFKCCGVYGDKDSTKSWYIYQSSEWFDKGLNNGSYVPDSCCLGTTNLALCTGSVNNPGYPPRQPPPVKGNSSTWGYTLYTRGCFDVLDPYLHRTGITIGTTAIVVGLFMLVELVLSICLYRTLPEKT
ncbi:CD151 antigen [Aplysia californica]|uniref:Tetraspanin n=1 Tax=Aplysia californica TaxID=6500 RepID=A0ABM0JUB5_APLCA|nr:CD151 antigen [Aplysia californica]